MKIAVMYAIMLGLVFTGCGVTKLLEKKPNSNEGMGDQVSHSMTKMGTEALPLTVVDRKGKMIRENNQITVTAKILNKSTEVFGVNIQTIFKDGQDQEVDRTRLTSVSIPGSAYHYYSDSVFNEHARSFEIVMTPAQK